MTINLQNLINIGNVVNDGLGDDLRTAFEKVNSAFQITISTGTNIGGIDGGVFKDVVGNSLRFKNIVAGEGISVLTNDTSVVIQNDVAETLVNGENLEGSAGGVFAGKDGPIFQFKNIVADGENISVTTSDNTITVNTVLPVSEILTTFDFGPLSGFYPNPLPLALAVTSVDFGTVEYPSSINLELGTIA